jgi:hypothetical protein
MIGYTITQDLSISVRVWQATLVGIGLYMVLVVAVGAIFAVSDSSHILVVGWPPTYPQYVISTSLAATLFIVLFSFFTRSR